MISLMEPMCLNKIGAWLTDNVGLLTVAAIMLTPFFALQAQKWLDEAKEKSQRKLTIFKILMATFATRLSPDHVNALNMINIEFYGNSKVLIKWKTYLKHLLTRPPETLAADTTIEEKEQAAKQWFDNSNNLFIDLLVSISEEVNLPFDKPTLSSGTYYPGAFDEKSRDDLEIRKEFIKLLTGKTPLAVSFQTDKAAQEKQNKLQDSLIEYYDGKRSVKVIVEEKKQ